MTQHRGATLGNRWEKVGKHLFKQTGQSLCGKWRRSWETVELWLKTASAQIKKPI